MVYLFNSSMGSLRSILLISLIACLFVVLACSEPAVGRAVGVDSGISPSRLSSSTPLGESVSPETKSPETSDVKEARIPPTAEPAKIPPTAEPAKISPTAEPSKISPTAEPSKMSPREEPFKVSPTVEPIGDAKPSLVDSPTTMEPNRFSEYGFVIFLDEDLDLMESDLSVTGFLSEYPNFSQGLMSFNYNGADIALSWLPQGDLDSADLVDLGYSLLIDSQPENEFIPLVDGDLEVGEVIGRFGGLFVSDSEAKEAGGGLIGGWTCESKSTSFMLMVTSPDSTVLQLRFDRVISGFECP